MNGKEVPALICYSSKGRNTFELLRQMLQQIDELGILPQKEGGLCPFLIFDGHGSHIGLEFLKDMNNKAYRWYVCLGMPYRSVFWQLGNATKQNSF